MQVRENKFAYSGAWKSKSDIRTNKLLAERTNHLAFTWKRIILGSHGGL